MPEKWSSEQGEDYETILHNYIEEYQKLVFGLVAIRRKKKISQATLASRIDQSVRTISSFENIDHIPRTTWIVQYAIAIGARIHIEELPDTPPLGLS